jgi:hypothetical protein
MKQYLRKASERRGNGKHQGTVPLSQSPSSSSPRSSLNVENNRHAGRHNDHNGQPPLSSRISSLSAAMNGLAVDPTIQEQIPPIQPSQNSQNLTPNIGLNPVCVNCNQFSPHFKKCGACAVAKPNSVDICYCSAECQKAHWPLHKLTCLRKKIKKPENSEKSLKSKNQYSKVEEVN